MKNRRMLGSAIAVVAVALLAAGVGTADAGRKNSKKSPRGYLGVYMQEIDSDMKEGLDLKVDEGVLISGIIDDSPADEAGLEDGDVIVKFNGKAVTSPDELRDMVRDTAPGTKVALEIVRDGKNQTIELEISDRPSEFWGFSSNDWDPGDLHFARFMGGPALGIHATDLNDDLAPYFKTKAKSGVLVLDVENDTVAEKAGIKAGDVIQKVGDEEVSSVRGMRESLRDMDLNEGDEFDVAVLRNGKKQTLKATMDDQVYGRFFNGHSHGFHGYNQQFGPPRVQVERWNQDLRQELNELREEVEALKKELKSKS